MNNAGHRRAGRLGRCGARAVSAVVVLSAAALSSPGMSAAAVPETLLPDLVADPVTNAYTVVYADSAGERWLLRFDGHVHNKGDGPLELRASEPLEGQMQQVEQRVYDAAGGSEYRTGDPAPQVLFEPNDRHNHWHLRNAAGYSLWAADRTGAAAPGNKIGFCLLDSQRIEQWGPAAQVYTDFCEAHNPDAQTVTMGVSAGWRDTYPRHLDFQWVDISDVQPGRYAIRSDMDPDGVIIESGEDNQPSFVDVDVPGHVAKDFSRQVMTILSTSIPLPADTFGNPGTRQFRIDEVPKHGTLNRPVGKWFTAPSVTYKPDFGYTGQDSFRFSARDATNPFPRQPYSATASLGVGVLPVAVSSAPVSSGAVSGQSADFATATVAEPRRAPDVAWSLPRPDGRPIAAPQVELRNGDLIARTVPWQAGPVRLTVRGGRGPFGSCEADVPAGEAFTCLLATGVTPPQARGKTVVAELRGSGRQGGERSAPVPEEAHRPG